MTVFRTSVVTGRVYDAAEAVRIRGVLVGPRTAAVLTLVSLLAGGCGAAGSGDGKRQSRLIAADENGIHLIEPDGSGSRLIPGTKDVSDPVWSADGDWLAFSSGDGVYIMRPDGTDRRLVLKNAFTPSWSPDGKRLAVVRDVCEGEPDYDDCMLALESPADVYTVGVDGTDVDRLTSDPDEDAAPAWSPDGEWIAFTGADNIYLVRPDGTGRRLLLSGPFAGPAWSPDGKTIAFEEASEIAVADMRGGDRTNLTRRQGPDFAPAWSPDGKQIAFLASSECLRTGQCTAEEPMEVWVMNADGTNAHRVTKGGFGPPAWG